MEGTAEERAGGELNTPDALLESLDDPVTRGVAGADGTVRPLATVPFMLGTGADSAEPAITGVVGRDASRIRSIV